MVRAKVWMTLGLVGLIGLCWSSQALAQPADPPAGGDRAQRGDRQRPSPEEMKQRMEEWRKRASDAMRTSLGASEDEWKVLQPRIEKVQALQRANRGGMMRGMAMGGRGGRGGRDRGGNTAAPGATATPATPAPGAPEPSDIEKKTIALRTLLENKDAAPAQITEALGALRKTREKAATDLAAARKELREVVTQRQEASLVLQGILE